MDTKEMIELRERNAARVQAIKEQMGEKYLLHPANQITKKRFKAVLKTSKKARLNCL